MPERGESSRAAAPSFAGGARPTGVRYFVLALACAISSLLYLHRYAWSFVKGDVAQEFDWGPETLGWLDSLFIPTYGLAQIPSGILCDWFGAHLLLGGSILLWSGALGSIVFAQGLTSMACARLALGLGQAPCYPILNKVSKNWFPIGMRTTAQSAIATFFGRGGGAASFFLFGTVMLGWLGLPWRTAVLIFSGFGLLCGVAFLLVFRNTPAEHPWVNAAEADLIVRGDPQAIQATGSVLDWGRLFGSVTVWGLFLRGLASNMADIVFVFWIPLYLKHEKHLDFSSAGWLAALPLVGGACGGLFSGWLQSRVGASPAARRWGRSGIALTGKLLAAGLSLLSLQFVEAWAVMLVLVLVKFCSDCEQPAEWATISDIAGRNAATVFGCVNTVGALGGFIGSVLNGYILKWYSVDGVLTTAGWNTIFVVVALEYVFAAACWLWIDCRRTLDESGGATVRRVVSG